MPCRDRAGRGWARPVANDPTGALRERYLGEADGALYLIRPDQHVAARWAEANADDIRRAIRIATAQEARA